MWRDYDEPFRKRRAINTTSWAIINNVLWWNFFQIKSSESAERKFPNLVIHATSLMRVFAPGLTANFRTCILSATYHTHLHFAIFIQNSKSKL